MLIKQKDKKRKMRITDFRFGQFVSYFSRLVTKSKNGVFLSGWRTTDEEELIEKHFLDIWREMTNTNGSFLSPFELPNLMDCNRKRITQNNCMPRLTKKSGCTVGTLKTLWDHWKGSLISNAMQNLETKKKRLTVQISNARKVTCKITTEKCF